MALATIRNTQLDGWRAFAVMGVMWHHWADPKWRGPFPFEIGLFFFLTLTGFLITRILLRERAVGESHEKPWRVKTYIHFQKRRMVRILVPCYAAMLFAMIVGAGDIQRHFPWYFMHVSNFHMAPMEGWPSGTAHYWTLAIQMQFYLIWPLVVFLTPRRGLVIAFFACAILAPVSRWILAGWFPEIHHLEAVTTASADYFAVGALLALAMDRGMSVGDKRLKWGAVIAFVGYAVLYLFSSAGKPVPGFWTIQQTLVSVVFAGLISSTLVGFKGALGWVLEHRTVQHVGRLSYGLYLFHTPVPLFLGWVLPQLWHPAISGPLIVVRMLAFAAASWGLAFLCLRYLEQSPAPHDPRLAASPKK